MAHQTLVMYERDKILQRDPRAFTPKVGSGRMAGWGGGLGPAGHMVMHQVAGPLTACGGWAPLG